MSVPDHETSRTSMPPSTQVVPQTDASPKKPRKAFKIGGKNKPSKEAASSQLETTGFPISSHSREVDPPTLNSSPPPLPQEAHREPTPVVEEHEETPEEKAERKRAELKRRNEDIAKKQAQHKKKKRF